MLNIADGEDRAPRAPAAHGRVLGGMLGQRATTASFAAKLAVDPSLGSPLFLGAWMPAFFTDELADRGWRCADHRESLER